MTLIWLSLVAIGVLAGCSAGYRWGVEDTERRWSDAVARKADADATRARAALITALCQKIGDCERDGLCEPAHVRGLEEAIDVVRA